MPLVRFPLRNEFALGRPELHKATDREDPKAVLDGVAVAGLVGILRQLGDLAEFAAEVFHGLQEQVMTTASRSHKLQLRVRRIEAALPPLEKAVLAQTSHIHFAYTAGSEWHPRLQNEKNHFIYNDLPRFIMDSYEGCRDPPCLHLLDKFDAGGPGSCLKRYSDPTFFRRVLGESIEDVNSEQVRKDKKTRKSKRKSSSQKRGLPRALSNHRGRVEFTSPIVNGRSSPSQSASTVVNEQPSPSQTDSTVANEQPSSQAASNLSDTQPPPQDPPATFVAQTSHPQTSSMVVDDTMPRLDMGDNTDSLILRTESGYIELFDLSASMQHEEQESKEKLPSLMNCRDTSGLPNVETHAVENNFSHGSSHEEVASGSSCVTWDEKAEIVEFALESCDIEEVPEMHVNSASQVYQAIHQANGDQVDMLSNDDSTQAISSRNEVEEVESETDSFMDALNTIDSESEGYIDCQTKRELEQYSGDVNANEENGMHLCSDNRADVLTSGRGQLSPDVKDETQVAKMHVQTVNDANHDPFLAKCHVTLNMSSEVVKQESLFDSLASEDVTDKQIAECHATSNISSEVLKQESLRDSLTSVDVTDKQIAHSSDLVTLSGNDCGEVLERPEMESVVSVPSSTGSRVFNSPDPSSTHDNSLQRPKMDSVVTVPSSNGTGVVNLQDPLTDRVIDRICESTTSHSESSSTHSVGFWTNGGLLGLEPSKPPVFAAPNFIVSDHEARDSGVHRSSNHTNVIKPNNSTEKPVSFAGNPSWVENGHSSDNVKASTLLADLDGKNEPSSDSFPKRSIDQNVVSPDTKATSIQSGQVNDGDLVRMFGLGNRLLANGFRKSEDVSSVKTGMEVEQGSREPSAGFNRILEKAFDNQLGSGLPASSYISSPPLQHMKISFNPVNGFETSKLKLKFPDQNHIQESVADMFALFQLVPSPGFILQDVDSDSDDDTFCRSSPYMSDDCRSHCSDSNSEEWESGESPEGKDPELYEAFRRMSSMDSVSNLLQDQRETSESIHIALGCKDGHNNGAETNVSDPLVDFPSFDSSNPRIQESIETDATQNNQLELQNAREPTPLTPPLPPEQWRISKSFSSFVEEKPSESPKLEFDMKVMPSTMLQKHQIAAADQPQIIDEAIMFRPEKKRIEKPNLRKLKEASQSMKMDRKGDFLQQIRSKSFSLRPTVTEKQTAGSGAAANVKVTAILEKASAIRQATGSDDGEEDDTWSDSS